jgi:hypothetical protein
MSPINFVASGRRLMPPEERDQLKGNPDHYCDRAQATDEQTYEPAKGGKPLVEPGQRKVLIVYTRFFSVPRWKFVTEARNRFGDVLATCTRETYKEAVPILEDDLRGQQIIV